MTGRLPELHPLGGTLAPGTVLDGELVVLDEDGRDDFDGMRRRGFGQPASGRLAFVGRAGTGRRRDHGPALGDAARSAGRSGTGGSGLVRHAFLPWRGPHPVRGDSGRGDRGRGGQAARLRLPARGPDGGVDQGEAPRAGLVRCPRGGADAGGALRPGSRNSSGFDGRVRYAGRVEWGFTRQRFEELAARVQPTDKSPFGGWAPPGAVFFQSGVVAEAPRTATSHAASPAGCGPSNEGARAEGPPAQTPLGPSSLGAVVWLAWAFGRWRPKESASTVFASPSLRWDNATCRCAASWKR